MLRICSPQAIAHHELRRIESPEHAIFLLKAELLYNPGSKIIGGIKSHYSAAPHPAILGKEKECVEQKLRKGDLFLITSRPSFPLLIPQTNDRTKGIIYIKRSVNDPQLNFAIDALLARFNRGMGTITRAPLGQEESEKREPLKEIDQEYEISFVLKSETTGHLLPFHPYKILDSHGNVINEGETDESAEAVVEVPDNSEYEVEVESEDSFKVSGTIYQKDGRTPLANSQVQISPWQQNSYKLKTGESGQFELIGLPHGELTINYSGAILSLWVDRDISDGHFCLPLVDDEESEESDEEIGSTDNLILEFEDDEIPEAFVIDETELLD